MRAARLFALTPHVASGGGVTETVLYNGTSTLTGTPTGGSLPGILTDSSDSTYVAGVDLGDGPTAAITGQFADLVTLTSVASFYIIVRCSVTALDAADSNVSNFSGLTGGVSPSFRNITATSTITDIRVGPFTRTSGGASWTAAQFNALQAQVIAESTSGTARIYKLWAEATS